MVNKEKLVRSFNLIFLSVLSIAIVYLILIFLSSEKPVQSEECNQIDLGTAFFYESCFDAYSKKIFFGIKRGYDDFTIRTYDVEFFDFSSKRFELNDIPSLGGSEIYKIPSEKNPGSLTINLEIDSKEIDNICPISENVFVSYCSQRISGEDVELDYNPLKNIVNTNFVDLGSDDSSDTFSLSLVEKEKIWESHCSSIWDCSIWEPCFGNIQKRTCSDKNRCFIPTNTPETTRLCNGTCIERWQCKWSECSNGYTSPDCKDINNCGTQFDKPTSLKCKNDACTPNISCSEWSICSINYSFSKVSDELMNLGGTKNRICKDQNGCADPAIETSNCSVGIDIYTKTFKNCGTEYIGLYNKIDDELIARIDQGTDGNLHTNIFFEDGELSEYCDYCFDGTLNGDETKIDCGGSCISCYDKYGTY